MAIDISKGVNAVPDPGFGQGGVSSGLPNFANVVEQIHVSEVSICRHGIWGLP